MKHLFFILFMFFGVTAALAPDWVTRFGQSSRFPSERYLTGYGISVMQNGDLGRSLESARESAIIMLASSIHGTFTYSSRLQSTYGKAFQEERLEEEFLNVLSMQGSVELENMGTEFFYDSEKGMAYALVWIDRERKLASLKARQSITLSGLFSLQSVLDSDFRAGRYDEVRRNLPQLARNFEAIRKDGLLIEMFGGNQDIPELSDLLTFRMKIVSKLGALPAKDIGALAAFMAADLKGKLPAEISGAVEVVAPLSREGEVDSLGGSLKKAMEQELSLLSIDVHITDALPMFPQYAVKRAKANHSGSILLFSCTRFNWGIQYDAAFIDVASGERLAFSSGRLDSSVVKGQFSSRSLFEIQTGGGQKYVNREEGFRLYVQCTQPLYLRIICRLKGGLMLLPDPIYKNYYLPESENPRVLPGLFYLDDGLPCDCLEFLVSAEPFEELDLMEVVIGGRSYSAVSAGAEKESGSQNIQRCLKVIATDGGG